MRCYAFGRDRAFHGDKLHARSLGFLKRSCKFGMRAPVWRKIFGSAAFHNKYYICFKSFRRSSHKLADVLYAAFCGCIRKKSNAVFKERHSFNFYIRPAAAVLHEYIKAGVALFNLAADNGIVRKKPALGKPVCGYFIGRLRIDVYNTAFVLHCNEVEGGLALGGCGRLKINCAAGKKQFAKPPCVFHMDGDLSAVYKHFCYKSVGSGEENSLLYVFVFQSIKKGRGAPVDYLSLLPASKASATFSPKAT